MLLVIGRAGDTDITTPSRLDDDVPAVTTAAVAGGEDAGVEIPSFVNAAREGGAREADQSPPLPPRR